MRFVLHSGFYTLNKRFFVSVQVLTVGFFLIFPASALCVEYFLRADALDLYAGYSLAGVKCGEVYVGVQPLNRMGVPGLYAGGGVIDFFIMSYREFFVDTGWVGGGLIFDFSRKRRGNFFLDLFAKYGFYTRKPGEGEFTGSRLHTGAAMVKCFRAGCVSITAGFQLFRSESGEKDKRLFIYVGFSALNTVRTISRQ